MKKKRLWSCLLILGCLLMGARALAAGGAGETLVSLSYLKDTFLPALEKEMKEQAGQGTKAVYDAAAERVNSLGEAYASEQPGMQVAWNMTGTFQPMAVKGGDVITLSEGASLLWQAGSAAAGAGLVDATAGSEVPEGGALVASHRYINGLEGSIVAVTVRSDAATAATAGQWILTPGDQSVSRFYDLCRGDWYYSAARWAVDAGIIKGMSSTSFAPSGAVDRAMMATLLYRMEKGTSSAYQGKFTDVPAGQWYTSAVEWAARNKIVVGNGDGTFSPGQGVTREQIALMLYRYANLLGKDVSAFGSLDAYPDQDAVSSWAKKAMAWATGVKIIRGSNGSLLPQKGASRAEVVVMLQRFQVWADQN